MIIVDTNIVAEVMKAAPASAVVTWFNAQDSVSLFLAAITVGEIRYGLCIMPQGQRRHAIERGFDQIIATAFAGRILAFDEHAATHYGEVMGRRKEIGQPLSVPDGQIAAIARLHSFAIATRNVRDFLACGIEIVNPFLPSAPA
ncbi:MAG TPA: type II toxin-antitoxin system VapC family toxin [Thermoanaerobaculia bacterium]